MMCSFLQRSLWFAISFDLMRNPKQSVVKLDRKPFSAIKQCKFRLCKCKYSNVSSTTIKLLKSKISRFMLDCLDSPITLSYHLSVRFILFIAHKRRYLSFHRRAVSVQVGVFVQGVSVWRDLCSGVSVQGSLCQGNPPYGYMWAICIPLDCILVIHGNTRCIAMCEIDVR